MQVDHQFHCENSIRFLKYLFEFHIRTKILKSNQKSYFNRKTYQKRNIDIKIQNEKLI